MRIKLDWIWYFSKFNQKHFNVLFGIVQLIIEYFLNIGGELVSFDV